MNPSTLIGMLASLVLLASVLLFSAESPTNYLNLPGLGIVIETGNAAEIGPLMAVALLTTFYGILLSNLLFKPIAVKLERRTEERLVAMHMVMEGVGLISKRRLPGYIKETLNSFVANFHDEIRDHTVQSAGTEPAEEKGSSLSD